jgi:hypothetical protein
MVRMLGAFARNGDPSMGAEARARRNQERRKVKMLRQALDMGSAKMKKKAKKAAKAELEAAEAVLARAEEDAAEGFSFPAFRSAGMDDSVTAVLGTPDCLPTIR